MADTVVEPVPGPPEELGPSRDPTPHAEHEAPAADDLALADLSSNPPADLNVAVDDSAIALDESELPDAAPEAQPLGKVAAAKAKLASTVKSAGAKSNGAAAGVKKVLSSSTAGKSSKPANSAGPPPASKAPMPSSKPAATAAATPARRTSLASSKPSAPPGPMTKPSLSSSSSSKPTTATATATARGVVSPVGSAANGTAAARPRASVSEGVKRAPLAARQSLSAATKSSSAASKAAPSSSATATKAPPPKTSTAAPKARTTASITSIKEVQEDTKALDDLQTKLQEATDSLVAKTEAATELEGQVEGLKVSLASALADAEAKGSMTAELTDARAASDLQLKDATEALATLRSEHQAGTVTLQAIQEDLAAARTAADAQKELIENLQVQIQSLEAELSASKEQLESLQASQSGAASDIAAAAAVEHEALLKARADFSQIEIEIQALRTAHGQTLEEAQAKLEVAESKAALAESLESQLNAVRVEKEEAVSKLSEIEVEVLELKESQEAVEDERAKTTSRITSLEQELSQAIAATQQAIDSALAKEAEYTSQAHGTKTSHEEELKAVSEAHAQTTSQLEALKAELEGALASRQAASEESTRRLGEAEEGYLKKQTELSDEIHRITMELEGQEAQYNAKVDAVKAEHDKLLQEAFERAKAEASDLHQQDLQALRAESSSTMQQVVAAHETSLQDLKAEHASALETTVGDLEKQISKLNLELKATQDDLAKAKANVELARSEVENLTNQRDEARTALTAVPEVSPQHAEELSRLTNEVGVAKDDLQAVTEMLNLTKASLEEMSNNHTAELEEAAKGRAEEVTKLRAAHDEEVNVLVAQKSELLMRLSDLEGELATVKASIDAEVAPKANGNGAVAPPQSPGITKEELQRMHEAHNLKVHDMQAEHEKAIKALKDELEAAETKVDGLNAEVARKAMEIQYLESDQDDTQERITRLQEDLEAANEKLKATRAAE
ncbi:hypothetical protein B0H15DRAFT_228317 [Mycena belliarum]|uniref:Uncharacterized protein n=1 Tax=Mycena belliarum TaxID=1033014 RepID=A0AAD6XZS9_9AGAR|nr:hypothetical protein B0H15DRAFT_228317 [Mycena belliae]